MANVSVIIPTLNRPALLERAVRSVLAQTYDSLEIIVVIDGPDANTLPDWVRSLDPRIRVLRLTANVGLAEARNVGIRASTGRWIALLDDDDEWLPCKLEKQVAQALKTHSDYAFVPCRFIEQTQTLQRVMPELFPSNASRFSEYIYCRGGYLQPSTYFMSRALAVAVPFTKGLRHVEDTDWLLRMSRHPLVVIAAAEEPLSIYYNLNTGHRESETTSWKHALRWGFQHRNLFTRHSYPFFVARLCLNARRTGSPFSTFRILLAHAHRHGKITPKVLAYFLSYWFAPAETLAKWRTYGKRPVRFKPQILSQLRANEVLIP